MRRKRTRVREWNVCENVRFLTAKIPEIMVANRFSMAQPHKYKYKHAADLDGNAFHVLFSQNEFALSTKWVQTNFQYNYRMCFWLAVRQWKTVEIYMVALFLFSTLLRSLFLYAFLFSIAFQRFWFVRNQFKQVQWKIVDSSVDCKLRFWFRICFIAAGSLICQIQGQ